MVGDVLNCAAARDVLGCGRTGSVLGCGAFRTLLPPQVLHANIPLPRSLHILVEESPIVVVTLSNQVPSLLRGKYGGELAYFVRRSCALRWNFGIKFFHILQLPINIFMGAFAGLFPVDCAPLNYSGNEPGNAVGYFPPRPKGV